jgi:N-methylhydantoinase A
MITRLAADKLEPIERILAELRQRVDTWFELEGIGEPDRQVRRVLDLRYVGQNYELPVELPSGPARDWLTTAAERFHTAHEQRYGHATPETPIEAVTFRVEAVGRVPKASLPRHEPVGADASGAVIGSRSAYFPEFGGVRPVPLYDRTRLQAGNVIMGPAVIEQYDTTALLLPGERARVDEQLLIITDAEESR